MSSHGPCNQGQGGTSTQKELAPALFEAFGKRWNDAPLALFPVIPLAPDLLQLRSFFNSCAGEPLAPFRPQVPQREANS